MYGTLSSDSELQDCIRQCLFLRYCIIPQQLCVHVCMYVYLGLTRHLSSKCLQGAFLLYSKLQEYIRECTFLRHFIIPKHLDMHVCVCVLVYRVHTFNSCTSRPDVYQCLVLQTPIGNMFRNMPSKHPCPRNSVAIGRAVVYYARAAHAFTTGIKCWHCMCVCL